MFKLWQLWDHFSYVCDSGSTALTPVHATTGAASPELTLAWNRGVLEDGWKVNALSPTSFLHSRRTHWIMLFAAGLPTNQPWAELTVQSTPHAQSGGRCPLWECYLKNKSLLGNGREETIPVLLTALAAFVSGGVSSSAHLYHSLISLFVS